MKKTEFNKIIRSCCKNRGKGMLDISKVSALPENVKSNLVYHIVRNRGPIVVEFIPKDFDMSWLASMAYIYTTKGKNYTFIHTSEQKII